MGAERCGYAVTDSDGIQQPCDRPATGWRWYQDCEHEDTLDVACDHHANEGGRRMHEAEAAVARVRIYITKWIGDELNTAIDKEAAAYCLQDALAGSGAPARVEVAPGATDDAEGPQIGELAFLTSLLAEQRKRWDERHGVGDDERPADA